MIPILTIYEKKEFDTFNREETKSHGDDELNTPPFFRRKK
ncbi:conserved domain protein [Enterococcus faecium PC4.1]|nr:conserved domain protein [Enterococcus faecium PC4.1]